MDGQEKKTKKFDLRANKPLYNLINTALFTALIMLGTMVAVPVVPGTGYVHIGDAFIFIACYFIGWWAVPATVLGSVAADLILSGGVVGGIYFVPATAVVKLIMPLIIVLIFKAFRKKSMAEKGIGAGRLTLGFLAGSVVMQAGYAAYWFILPFMSNIFEMPAILGWAFWIAFAFGFLQTIAGYVIGLPVILRLRNIKWVKEYFFLGKTAAPFLATSPDSPPLAAETEKPDKTGAESSAVPGDKR